jgi:thiol-disulfide isomerase/thioredoxin
VLGKKPIALCYWIAGNSRSEKMLLDLQAMIEEMGPGKIVLYGVAMPGGKLDANQIRSRATELKLRVPVLEDEGFRIGQQVGVRTVPHVSLIDAEGVLRLANGASLQQNLEYKMDLAGAVRRAAETGTVGMYGYLPKYYPAEEMVGQKCPDFEAPALDDGVVRKWSSILDPKRVNILVFWSVDCPHCRKQLPEIDEWLKSNPGGVNLVTAAKISNDVEKSRTREYTRLNGFSFTTLMDVDRKIGQEFKVTSTPTIFIVRPDGVVDSVMLSGAIDFAKTFEAKKRELLGS